jgi:hypothetical protein
MGNFPDQKRKEVMQIDKITEPTWIYIDPDVKFDPGFNPTSTEIPYCENSTYDYNDQKCHDHGSDSSAPRRGKARGVEKSTHDPYHWIKDCEKWVNSGPGRFCR